MSEQLDQWARHYTTFGTMTNILIANVKAKHFKFSKSLDSLDFPTTD
jgi:hypothetical protein